MVKSPMTDVDLVEVPLHYVVFEAMQTFADRVAVVDGVSGKEYTFSDIYNMIRRLASGLRRMGLKHKDIVVFISPNSVEYLCMFYAVLACGASVSTVNPVYTAYELRKHLEDSRGQMLFVSPETAKTAIEASRQAGLNQKALVSGTFPGCISVDTLLADDGSLFPEAGTIPFNVKENIATIPYSSGTTGFPKGVMITHFNLASMLLIARHPDIRGSVPSAELPQQTIIAFLPYFHAFGMVSIMIGAILRGDKQIIMPRFEAERFLQLIEKYKVTVLTLVPPVVVMLTKSALTKKYDLSSIKVVGVGAAPLSRESEEDFRKLLQIPAIKQGWGMTETTIGCTSHLLVKADKPGSCGVPLPNCEVQVVDPSSQKVLGPDERGELWFRGPNVMKGYLNRPDATRETIDSQGWLHTGDIGYYDKDSYIYVVDRMKELIKYKGFQVAPAELEALLLSHPAIADVAVIGVPDHSAGELPRAYVVRKPNASISEDQVKQYVADHVSAFKHLRGGVEFVANIPKSPSGKILRRELRANLKTSKL